MLNVSCSTLLPTWVTTNNKIPLVSLSFSLSWLRASFPPPVLERWWGGALSKFLKHDPQVTYGGDKRHPRTGGDETSKGLRGGGGIRNVLFLQIGMFRWSSYLTVFGLYKVDFGWTPIFKSFVCFKCEYFGAHKCKISFLGSKANSQMYWSVLKQIVRFLCYWLMLLGQDTI